MVRTVLLLLRVLVRWKENVVMALVPGMDVAPMRTRQSMAINMCLSCIPWLGIVEEVQ